MISDFPALVFTVSARFYLRRGMRRLEIIKAAGGDEWSRGLSLGGLRVA